ncbi:MAG: YggS family pyridoxal phosphate-dependent enzyme, partial [Alphaproteobacteria bacterium HGW-Alphaproteobacteria-2]
MSLAEITERLRAAEVRAGRAPGSVRLIAVSKMQPEARIAAVLEAGHRLFGENRVQEAAGRWPSLRARYPGAQVHLIGPLQGNKARQA